MFTNVMTSDPWPAVLLKNQAPSLSGGNEINLYFVNGHVTVSVTDPGVVNVHTSGPF